MRVPYLLQTLFALGRNSPEFKQICNGLATTTATAPLTFVGTYQGGLRISDVSSSPLLLAKKKSASLLDIDEFDKGINLTTASGEWLKKRLRFTEEELNKVFDANNRLLTLEISVLEERAIWLQKRLSLKDAELPKTVKKFPNLLGLSVEDSVEPKLNWLQQRLNVTDIQLGKIVTKDPTILARSIENSLEPKIKWIQKKLNLDKTQVGKLVVKLPSALHLSIDANLEPKLEWLQIRLDLNNAQVSKIARTRPSIFGYSVSALEPTLMWLQEKLSLEDTGLAKLIVALPTLLGYRIETNLEPTLNFFVECVGEDEAKRLVTKDPRLFSASVEGRLKPRLEQAREAGLTVDSACIKRIVKYTEDEWQTSLAFQERKVLAERVW